MEGLIVLILIALVVLVIVLPITAMVRASEARRGVESLGDRLRQQLAAALAQDEQMQRRLRALERQMESIRTGLRPPDVAGEAAISGSLAAAEETGTKPAAIKTNLEPGEKVAPAATPPPLPPVQPPAWVALPRPAPPTEPVLKASSVPAKPVTSLHPQPSSPPASASAVEEERAFTLEQFMGVKLFAWIGGLALFLGIVFFVKLSIERGWISRELRTAIGFVTGLGLVAGGMRVSASKAYAVLGQTLCATGIVVLYGMTYVAHAFYKFPLFASPATAFALMSLVTMAAFLLAVRMDAQVVAVLGMLGGFLTPILCSTGKDNPLGLFGYIALLDIGVLAVAKRSRWLHLTALAAAGTLFMQAGWCSAVFQPEGYAYGAKTWIAIAVFLGFAALFGAAAWRTRLREDEDLHPAGAALALCGSAMAAAFYFLNFGTITERPWLLYGFVLGVNVVTMAVAWKEPRVSLAPVITGLATFAHLAAWTTGRLTNELLPQALAIYLLFGLLHTAYGVIWQQRQTTAMRLEAGWVPVATLLLLLVPVLHFESVSFMVWPALLVVDLGIIGLALLSRSLLPVFSALLLTMLTVVCWLFKLPVAADASLASFLVVLGGFAIVFAIASSLLARKVAGDANATEAQNQMAGLLPVASAAFPFALLVLAMLHLRVANPSPVFGLALLLNVFLLGISRITKVTALPMAGLLCTLAMEGVWHVHNFDPQHPVLPLLWYLGFHALFTLHPHVFRRHLQGTITPWATAALAGAGTFTLVYALVDRAWPNGAMGLLPLAFAAPQLASLMAVLKLHRADHPARTAQIAWFGGMSLFFITLIFPIQFEKEWLTVSWALEGAALCWLCRRVPHDGLRATGTALLLIAFVRLTLNPETLAWHERGPMPIWNWQLYTYSLAALSMFAAAWWLNPPRSLLGGINLRGLFSTLGGILLFLLLNIEIADAFTPAGSRTIVFDFSGNFARDMTYSIAWGLFALALLMIGFATRTRGVRYAGVGLLAATLLKLFLHDLASLDSVYRIGALIVVALTALAASFLYQRFLSNNTEPDDHS